MASASQFTVLSLVDRPDPSLSCSKAWVWVWKVCSLSQSKELRLTNKLTTRLFLSNRRICFWKSSGQQSWVASRAKNREKTRSSQISNAINKHAQSQCKCKAIQTCSFSANLSPRTKKCRLSGLGGRYKWCQNKISKYCLSIAKARCFCSLLLIPRLTTSMLSIMETAQWNTVWVHFWSLKLVSVAHNNLDEICKLRRAERHK